jgi:hypothetical protein
VHPELKMKRLVLVLLAIVMLGLLALGAADKAPAIAFDGIAKDFGTVTEGEMLKYVFPFKNKGDATLEILKVEPS